MNRLKVAVGRKFGQKRHFELAFERYGDPEDGTTVILPVRTDLDDVVNFLFMALLELLSDNVL